MRRAAASLLGLVALLCAACDTDPRKAYTTVPETVPTEAPTTVAPPTTCTATPGAPTTRQYTTIDGVDANLLSVDVYPLPPSCGPRPVLFFVHGGEWTGGDKADGVAPIAAFAARYGWVLVSVNHRLSSDGGTVQWPDHGNDVAVAIADTLDHAGDLGIDPQHVAVMGTGSGGQLAAIVTVDPRLLKALGHAREEIGCLVELDGEGFSITTMIDDGAEETVLHIETVFGDDFQTYQKASPNFALTQAQGRVADTLVVTGGDLARQAVAVDFADLVKATGATATVVLADGYDGAQMIAVLDTATDTVVAPAVTDFLTTCLA